MGYRWVEHTGEVELEIEAPTAEGVFAQALRALAELIGPGAGGKVVTYELVLAGGEPAALLAGWLDELVYRAETEDLVPEEVERFELDEDGVRASVRCRRGSPRHLVKGATYHRLAFESSERGFRARVVLDV
jgi:SHS2 domain-containing protein